jgi:hypothetical protein
MGQAPFRIPENRELVLFAARRAQVIDRDQCIEFGGGSMADHDS